MADDGRAADSVPSPGALLAGKYRVERVLGTGGMGVVIGAVHLHLRERVAIKLIRSPRLGALAIARFLREARAASRLRGEHVVRVFDVAVLDDGRPYLVMEYLSGRDLAALVAASPQGLPVAVAVDYVLQACEAVAEAHALGIIDRDLKPANLFLTHRPDGSACVKVLDFGISKIQPAAGGRAPAAPHDAPDAEHALSPLAATRGDTEDVPSSSPPANVSLTGDPGAGEALTGTGAGLGTPRYMAPEQRRSPRDVDARADVWSLGAILYELLAGRPAFAGDSLAEIWGEEAGAASVRLRSVRPEVPEGLEDLIARCLDADLAVRPATVAALAAALAPFGDAAAADAAARVARVLGAAPGSAVVIAGVAGDSHAGVTRHGARASGGGAPPGLGAVLPWLAPLGATVLAAALAAPSYGRPAAGVAGADTPPPPAPTAAFSLERNATLVAKVGDCTLSPAFADDGSLVFAAAVGEGNLLGNAIYRLEPGSEEPRAIAAVPDYNDRPAPGGEGRILFAHSPPNAQEVAIQSVALDGSSPRTEVPLAVCAWAAGDSLFFLRHDHRAIERRGLEDGALQTLFEAPSGAGFLTLSASRDGRWIATNAVRGEDHLRSRAVCVGEARPGAAIDCTSAGAATSVQPAFPSSGGALYFARGDSLVRFDLATHATSTQPMPFAAIALAIAPTDDRLVASSCRARYAIARLDGAGVSAAVDVPFKDVAEVLAVGPHGEVAFTVQVGDTTQLALTSGDGRAARIITSGPRVVAEMAFSPDGQRIVFRDSSAEEGGLFVADVTSAVAPRRLTTSSDDSVPLWLDADDVLFLHPEKGFTYGRSYVVPAAGGAATPLPPLGGLPFGTVPARGSILLAEQSVKGFRFFERARGGRLRPLVLAGVPREMPMNFVTGSPSGRYVAWATDVEAYVADFEKLTAVRAAVPTIRGLRQLQTDDAGRIVGLWQRAGGELYEVRGVFP
jgi:serine/threonine-protein kinase